MSGIDRRILETVLELQSFYARVFPSLVNVALGEPYCDRQMRRKMARLANEGKLERIGRRMGYRAKMVH